MNRGTFRGWTQKKGLPSGALYPELKRLYWDEATLRLNAGHVDTLIIFRSASAVTVTLPAGLPLKDGAAIHLFRFGAGQVTLVPAAGVTVRAATGLKTRAQYSVITLMQIDATLSLYSLFGDMGA